MRVDRDQIRRDAEILRDALSDSSQLNGVVLRDLARHCLALLAELDQADQEKRLSNAQISRLTEQVNEAESRLTNLPALVEAAKRFDEHIEINGGCHKGCPEHDALTKAISDYEKDSIS